MSEKDKSEAQAGERGEHAGATQGGSKSRATVLQAAGVLGVGAVAAVLLFGFTGGPKDKPVEKTQIRATASYQEAPDRPAKALFKPERPVDAGTVGTVVEAAPRPLPIAPVQPAAPTQAEMLMDSARRAPVIAFTKSQTGSVGAASNSAFVTASGPVESDDRGAFERRLVGPKLEGARAGLIGNRDMVIAMGTSIPCTLETALQSDQPGFTSCVIDRDVLSDNGRVVLLEKGTQVVGEYRGGLKQGQARLHVLWSRAKTPTGVVIELASAGTDQLGRAGFGGYVDNHFMERFGSAILLSVVSDLTKIGGEALTNSTGYSANGTTSSGKDAAAIAVEQTAGMAPTLHKHQGEIVSIFVSRDLDFSTVYSLKMVKERTAGPQKWQLDMRPHPLRAPTATSLKD
jgi:type IV secretion system protein VirB10